MVPRPEIRAGELVREAILQVGNESSPSSASRVSRSTGLRHGHRVSKESGSLQITRTEAENGSGGVVGFAWLWTAASLYFLVAQFGILPVGWETTWRSGEPTGSRFLHAGPTFLGVALCSGFLLLGLGLLAQGLEGRYGEQVWIGERAQLRRNACRPCSR